MSYAYDMGLRSGRCNGCKLKQFRHELGDKFIMLNRTIYELDAEPCQGQGEPLEHEGRPVQFVMWGASWGHSDECYNWKPPRKKKG